jgi:hypothetical protein
VSQRQPVPGDVSDAAVRVCVLPVDGSPACQADRAAVRQWAAARYPDRHPADVRDCAFWALGVAANCGVARVVRD